MMVKKFKNKSYFSIVLFTIFLLITLPISNIWNSSFSTEENSSQVYSSSEYESKAEVLSAQEFALMVDESDTDHDGNVDIIMENDVDLSDFDNSTVNLYDNEYAVHGFNDVKIDFNGHTVTNKTHNYTLEEFNDNNQNVTTSLNYDNDWSNYGQDNSATEDGSFFYLYWFYDIENLTIENGNFIGVPMIAYDIGTLTIENSAFYSSDFSNTYFSSTAADLNGSLASKHASIGLIADQVSNMNLNNVLVSNYSLNQNVYSFSLPGSDYYNNSNLGIFTRIGENSSSVINVNNVSFDNLSFDMNEKANLSNSDGLINIGVFVALKGNISMSNVYFNDIYFVLNNDLNSQRNNSLVSIVENDLGNLYLSNIFIGNVFTSNPEKTRIFGTAYEYDAGSLQTGGLIVLPSDILKVDPYKNEINYINYTAEENNEVLTENLISPSLVDLNIFADVNHSFITKTESEGEEFFDTNFDSNYYKLENGEFPTPIEKILERI